MLPRAIAFRTAKSSPSIILQSSKASTSVTAVLSSRSRTFATGKKPSKSAPIPPRAKPYPTPPRAQPSRLNTRGPGVAATGNVASQVQGARPTESNESPVGSAPAQEPVAQKADLDEPVPGSARATAQESIAASENTPAPENATETAQPEQQQTFKLPDLRQGIPSTFDFEFGNAGKGKAGAASEGQADKFEKELDMASEEAGDKQRGDKGEREYDASAYETSTDRRRNQMANYLFASTIFAALGAGFYFSRPFSTSADLPSNLSEEDAFSWSPTSMYARVRARMGGQVGYYTEPAFTKLLPEVPEGQRMPFTLVLSLEDLMIHTTWDTKHGYRIAKRPGLDYFIRYLSQYYELVLFTSAPRAMADPVMAKLDPFHFIMWPLGREATKYEGGEYIKDLAYLNRDLKKTLIIDTHAPHVQNQPENAILLPKWSGDPKDKSTGDLVGLIPFLEYLATMGTDDVRVVLDSFRGKSIPEEFARREAIAREEFNRQLSAERRRAPKFSLGSLAGGLGVSQKGMGGGMVLADGQSVAEGLREGKMLSDQIREQGQKQYMHLEQQIREHGEQWLREEKEEQQKMMDASMKEMKQGALGWFGGSGSKPSAST